MTVLVQGIFAGANRMDYELVEHYYSREVVKREVADYCKSRWVALEGGALGSRVFLRYWRDGRPLRIDGPQDVESLIKQFKGVRPRAVYGSVNVYSRLASRLDLEVRENIAYASPVWDIDGELERWRDVIEVARIIVNELEKLGVTRSVFVKWSGEGAHVHVHERCFSGDVLSEHNPLDVAYSLVDYILERCRSKILDVTSRSSRLKVENEIDLKRVFTAPLSLHRKRDLCCVCLKPEVLDGFEIEWANPEGFRHDERWREYVEGEGDEAALKAIEAVGGYRGWPGAVEEKVRTTIAAPKPVEVEKRGKIGRFQVMGLLQATRYYLLTGDLEKAKSFGLNRAIFYAWAKKHAREIASKREASKAARASTGGEEKAVQVGNETAFVSERGWFEIGGEEQRPEDYDRQIAQHIGSVVPYERAWQAALEYLKGFDKEVLLDQQKFFKEVYEPVRDRFLEDVVLNPRRRLKPEGLFKWFSKRGEGQGS
jgi:DNA primase catalytic subunit